MVPSREHLVPLGQHTSPGSISLMAVRVQLKQNLCNDTLGHCTKSVPSSNIVQFRQFISGAGDFVPLSAAAAAGAGVVDSVLSLGIIMSVTVACGVVGSSFLLSSTEICSMGAVGLLSGLHSPSETRVSSSAVVGMVGGVAVERVVVWIGIVVIGVMELVVGEKADSDLFKLDKLS